MVGRERIRRRDRRRRPASRRRLRSVLPSTVVRFQVGICIAPRLAGSVTSTGAPELPPVTSPIEHGADIRRAPPSVTTSQVEMQPASTTIAILPAIRASVEPSTVEHLLVRRTRRPRRLEILPFRPARERLGRGEDAIPRDQRLARREPGDDAIADLVDAAAIAAQIDHDALRVARLGERVVDRVRACFLLPSSERIVTTATSPTAADRRPAPRLVSSGGCGVIFTVTSPPLRFATIDRCARAADRPSGTSTDVHVFANDTSADSGRASERDCASRFEHVRHGAPVDRGDFVAGQARPPPRRRCRLDVGDQQVIVAEHGLEAEPKARCSRAAAPRSAVGDS